MGSTVSRICVAARTHSGLSQMSGSEKKSVALHDVPTFITLCQINQKEISKCVLIKCF